MKYLLICAFFALAACNNDKAETSSDEVTTDPTKNTDTRTVQPTDTTQLMDTTGAYKTMSDSLRKDN